MRYTTETFIEKLRSKRDDSDSFDYSAVEYHPYNPITVICTKHGPFTATAVSLLHGSRGKGKNCPTCGSESRRRKTIKRNISERGTQDSFIVRAKEKHGDLYDYTSTVFVGIRHHVKIRCLKHGIFSQMAQAHIINGQGCPSCFRENRRSYGGGGGGRHKQEFVNFIEEASAKYNGRYDYTHTDLRYRDEKGRISIRCPDHGEFWVRPGDHIQKKAQCQECSKSIRGEKSATKNRLTIEEFVARARNIHGDRYMYEETEYSGATKPLFIRCSTHGLFKQRAGDHLSGNGCQKCSNFATSDAEQKWLDSHNIVLRQKLIRVGERRFYVDGFDPETNTIYEFLGDYWHGNPQKYNPNDINHRTKKSFGELFSDTKKRIALLERAGYRILSIWESEWNANKI